MSRFSDWVKRDVAQADANLRTNLPRLAEDPWYRHRTTVLVAVSMVCFAPGPPLLATGHYWAAGACLVSSFVVNQVGGFWLNRRADARDLRP